jgi:hypothetical protein
MGSPGSGPERYDTLTKAGRCPREARWIGWVEVGRAALRCDDGGGRLLVSRGLAVVGVNMSKGSAGCIIVLEGA